MRGRSAVEATHRLLTVKAQAITAGRQSVSLDVRVYRVSRHSRRWRAKMCSGDATIKARIDFRDSDIGFTLDSAAGVVGRDGSVDRGTGETGRPQGRGRGL